MELKIEVVLNKIGKIIHVPSHNTNLAFVKSYDTRLIDYHVLLAVFLLQISFHPTMLLFAK